MKRAFHVSLEDIDRSNLRIEEAEAYIDWVKAQEELMADKADELLEDYHSFIWKTKEERAAWRDKFVVGDGNEPFFFCVFDTESEAKAYMQYLHEEGGCPYIANELEYMSESTFMYRVFFHGLTRFQMWFCM